MSTDLEHWFSALDLGPSPRDLGPREYLWGANLAVRRTAVARAHGFRPAVARRDSTLPYGEDVDLQRRIDGAGYRRRYVADAVVNHLVGSERCSLRWVVHRAWRQGCGEARYDRDEWGRLPLAPAARRVAAHAAYGAVRDVAAIVRGPTRAGALVQFLCTRCVAAGYLSEAVASLRR